MVLDDETSKHIVQVLRMKKGESLKLTDGKGNLLTAEISNDHKKHCGVKITDSRFTPHDSRKITIAISLLKNSNRFEWFLEKATEIGVSEIIPLICTRTEKEKFRQDRMQNILMSAMLQSQQYWLPLLHQPTLFDEVLQTPVDQKFIAHCEESNKQSLSFHQRSSTSKLILIGPEGDFTPEEIEAAYKNNFIPVSLGNTRLRTETAAIVAATVLCVY